MTQSATFSFLGPQDDPDPPEVATPVPGLIQRWSLRCEEHAQSEGLARYMFGLSLPQPQGPAIQFVLTNYPSEWLRIYDGNDYLRIDPVAARLRSSVAPFAWDEVEAHGSKIAAFWRRAERFGLRHGYTIPLNGPRGQRAAFGLSGTTQPIPIEGRRERFGRSWSFAVSLLEDMLREYEPREVTGEQRLTSQQKQALSMIALGLSIRDIAARLELHPRTVEYHLHGALERLGAATREQAIVRALLSGEIESLQYPDELRDWCVRSDGQ